MYQEDVLGYANAADPDLREGDQPVSWRRVYGFAQNSHLLDRGFLFGSLSIIIIWLTYPLNPVHVQEMSDFIKSSSGATWIVGYLAVGLLFAAGETQRRDKLPKLPQLKPIQYPLLIGGIVLLIGWAYLFQSEILSNVAGIIVDPLPIIAGAITIPVVSYLLVKYYTRGGRKAVV